MLWFMKLMRPVVKYLMSELGYLVLPWIDDLYARPPTVVALPLGATVGGRAVDLTRSSGRSASLIIRAKAAGGAQVLEHLRVLIGKRKMRVFVKDRKVQRMRQMAQEILLSTQWNRCLVAVGNLRHFCVLRCL
jgi:hypothetical protein